jgi:tRNA G18 (ribose-2'-O)-methylase SpoU
MNAGDYCLSNSQLGHEKQSASQPHVHFLLDDLQSPINIGKCARVAEIFGMDLYIHDPRNLTKHLEALQTINDFACGAWKRRKHHVINSAHSVSETYKKGRLVATCLQEDAVRLRDFEFAENDLIMFGNEYDGLHPDIIEKADAKIYIAMPNCHLPKPTSRKPIDPSRTHEVNQNGIPNLNVAVAAGIVGYAFSCWLEKNGYMPFEPLGTQRAEEVA